jgi:hypothetical protein
MHWLPSMVKKQSIPNPSEDTFFAEDKSAASLLRCFAST